MFRTRNFIERSILSTLSFFKESVFCDEYAVKNGFLQKLDARVKAASFMLLLFSAVWMKEAYYILGIYALVLIAAVFSEINLGFFLKRTWFFIPLFSLFIAIPALFSMFSPGQPAFVFSIFSFELVITKQGMLAAGLFISRVITCVSLAVLVALTTRHSELLMVLRIFGVPQVFVATLGMCYRYIYLFAEIVGYTFLSIKSRVGAITSYKKGQEVVAWNIACLWQRSYHFNNQVYDAMLSRGYSGEHPVLKDFKTSVFDWVMLAVSFVIFVFALRIK